MTRLALESAQKLPCVKLGPINTLRAEPTPGDWGAQNISHCSHRLHGHAAACKQELHQLRCRIIAFTLAVQWVGHLVCCDVCSKA